MVREKNKEIEPSKLTPKKDGSTYQMRERDGERGVRGHSIFRIMKR